MNFNKLLIFIFIFIFLTLISTQIFSKSNVAKHICPKNHEVYFSCLTKAQKFINICKNSEQGIQYFFGKPQKIELMHPIAATSTNSDFAFSHYFRPNVDYTELRFSKSTTTYTLHDYQSNEPNDKKKSIGITITNSSDKELELECRKIFTNKLNQLKIIVPCDSESALSGENCKQ